LAVVHAFLRRNKNRNMPDGFRSEKY
jgi:hypothetical protein